MTSRISVEGLLGFCGERALRNLSPWGLATKKELYINGRPFNVYDIGGITDLDYLELYKKFTYVNQESYRLDYIANVELGQQKLDHSEFDTFQRVLQWKLEKVCRLQHC